MKTNRTARKSGRRRGLAFALVAALAVAACGGSDDASESADDSATEETTAPEASSGETKTTLTIVSPQEPASWNYYEVAANALRVPTFKNVQETVVELNPDGTITPMLAESWEVSDDGLGIDGAKISRSREGIGLSNTRERLNRIYGIHSQLVLKSEPGLGTTVSMVLPCRI